VLIAVFAGCGDDDPSFPQDGGRDSGDASGRGGAAGGDAGRADTNTGGGGSGGSSDAGPDRSSDGQGGADAAPDITRDSGPTVDVSADADGTSIADSAVDRIDGDGSSGFDGPAETGGPGYDAADAPEVDTRDGADGPSLDASGDADVTAGDADASAGDADASAGDASDATFVDAADATSVDVNDAASCDDSNPASIDFYHPTYGCGHKFDANPGDSDAWITYDAGFHVDVATGLGWVFPAGSRSASAASTLCDSHSVAGLTDWRMATIDEARSLADGCAPTKAGGSCPLDDPTCLASSCGVASPACDSCSASGGPHAGQYCKVDAVCSFFHTSSACSDCSDASFTNWIYIPINANFYPMPSGAGIPTACVSVVPNGVPASDGG